MSIKYSEVYDMCQAVTTFHSIDSNIFLVARQYDPVVSVVFSLFE
jgi:hypothetical protein